MKDTLLWPTESGNNLVLTHLEETVVGAHFSKTSLNFQQTTKRTIFLITQNSNFTFHTCNLPTPSLTSVYVLIPYFFNEKPSLSTTLNSLLRQQANNTRLITRDQ